MSDEITFNITDEGATEVPENQSGAAPETNGNDTGAGSAFNPGDEKPGSDQAFNPNDSTEGSSSDPAPENDAGGSDDPAGSEESDTQETPPSQPTPPAFDPKDIGKVLVDSLAPLIDNLQTQQKQQTQAQRKQEIESRGMSSAKAMNDAKKAINAAKTQEARDKAMDAYAAGKAEYDKACVDAKALMDEMEGKGTGENANQNTQGNDTGSAASSQGDNAAGVNPKVQARIDKWMQDNKAWFSSDPKSRWYNLSEAAVAESERLYFNDPDPEVRDMSSDKHWAKVNEFIRQKTGRAATTKGAGGQTFTQPPVDTSAGTNVTPTTSTGTTKKSSKVTLNKKDQEQLNELLHGFYGTTDRKKIGPARVKRAIEVMQETKKKRSK